MSLVRALVLAVGATCSMAACTTAPGERGVAVHEEQCRDHPVQWAVGQVINDATVNRIQVESRASQVRRVRPGQPMTRDFRRDRINVQIDSTGTIKAVACG